MSLQEHQKDDLDRTSLSTRQSPFLALWRARVTKYDVAYFQVRRRLRVWRLMQ
jgi:hypothetical protein